MKNANINVRIEESIYKKIKELDINTSEIIRNALINEIEKRRVENIMKELENASKAVEKIGIRSIVKEIRKDREQR